MDKWIVTANTTSATSTTGTTSIASTSVTTVTSTSTLNATAANAQTITKTCTTPTQKRKLHVVQSPESNPESPHYNSSKVFRLKIDRSKMRSLADLDKPGTSQLTQATVPVEIHHVVHFQDSSENKENSKSDPKQKKNM